MKNRVSKNQNTMYYEDLVYEAREVLTNSCTGCSFYIPDGCTCKLLTHCSCTKRKDKRTIIWKLKDTSIVNYPTRTIRLLKS